MGDQFTSTVFDNGNSGQSKAPLASVIVPTHNSEEFLTECLDSVLAQTLDDLELIIVDDCSTDRTLEILKARAQADTRMRIVQLESHGGPGIARNRGIEEARGTYLYFLDSDDFCDSRLLEKAVACLEKTGGDLCAFPFSCLNMAIGENVRAWWYLPPSTQFEGLRTWRDYPDDLFSTFQNIAWNKVFRRALIEEHQVQFQDIHLTEDLMFTAAALVCAEGIAVLDTPLVSHREAITTNTMSNKDSHPFDFITAFTTFKHFLESKGLMGNLRNSYLNWAADACYYNLNTMSSYDAFKAVFDRLANGAAEDLGLLEEGIPAFSDERYNQLLDALKNGQANEYLFRRFRMSEDELNARNFQFVVLEERNNEAVSQRNEALGKLDATQAQLDNLHAEHNAKMNAAEQRIGQALCRFPRFIQRTFFLR